MASCHFLPPWQFFFYFMRSYCSHLQINYKPLFLHGPRALWAQHLQLGYCCKAMIFNRCLCASACAFMMKFCDTVRLPAFKVEMWTIHVAAPQNADEMQNLQCFSNCRFSGSVVKMLTVLSFLSAGPFAHSLLQTDFLMGVDFEWIFGCDRALHLTHSHGGSWPQSNCPLPMSVCLWVQERTCTAPVGTVTAFPRLTDNTQLLAVMLLQQCQETIL